MKKTTKNKSKNIIGARVRKARLAFKPTLTQAALSGRLFKHKVDLDRSAVSRIENQERYVMDYEVIAIAKCLKVTVGYLLGEK